jgi:hypothetical protein
MILKSDTRPFLEEELKDYKVGMGDRRWNIKIEPIVNKFN